MEQEEVWKEIPGHPMYEASSLGRIRSVPRTIVDRRGRKINRKSVTLRPCYPEDGYPFVQLGRASGRRVHQLVAWAFIGPQAVGMYVCHKDGDKANSKPDNLYYGTAKENLQDRVKHGTDCRGLLHPNCKLSAEQVLEIRRRALAGENQRLLGREFGIAQPSVSVIKTGERWSHLE